jgi:hypothetical protein
MEESMAEINPCISPAAYTGNERALPMFNNGIFIGKRGHEKAPTTVCLSGLFQYL